jgi:ABC-type bacteriocin/lantibiotic exporter with double-glycine peptidase domain
MRLEYSLEFEMSVTVTEAIHEEPAATAAGGTAPRPFGWAWVWRSLRLRKWQVAAVLALTVAVYAAGLALPLCTQQAVDLIAAGTVDMQLVWLSAAAVIAIAMDAALTSVREKLVLDLSVFLKRRISSRAFLHLMRRRIDLGSTKAGEVLNRFQEADKIPGFVLRMLPQATFDAGYGVVSLLLMFYYDAVVGLATLVAAVASIVLLGRQLRAWDEMAEQMFKTSGKRQGVLTESVSGIITIKALALETQRFGRWKDVTETAISASYRLFDRVWRFHVSASTIMHTISLIVLALGCWRILHHDLTFGGLLALQLLAGRLFAPIVSSGDVLRQYEEAKVALAELGRLMAEPLERPAIRPPWRQLGNGGIAVRNLTLRYAPDVRPALDGVSFTLPAHGRFALVGRNGSGKSSLIRILLGLQRGYAGDVAVAGHDLRHYDPRALRGRIGIVDQDTFLFSGTVRENIAAGMAGTGDVQIRDAQIRDALAFAGALEFVEAMPEGLGAEIEENGRNLSGGQRQRLAVARAVVRDPRLVLLDEPTAFLDAEAAVALEQRLAAWGRDRLLILVTHHLAAARSADAILVLDQGRLAGHGSHAELLRDCAPYAALWKDYVRSMEGELVAAG